MPLEIPVDACDLQASARIFARQQRGDRGVGLELDVQAEKLALAKAGKKERCLGAR